MQQHNVLSVKLGITSTQMEFVKMDMFNTVYITQINFQINVKNVNLDTY